MQNFKKYLNKPTMTPAQIADKHGVCVDCIKKALKIGISVEREHTKNDRVAKEIALDHLGERPDYYDKLKAARL
jgi:hypothetical protein